MISVPASPPVISCSQFSMMLAVSGICCIGCLRSYASQYEDALGDAFEIV